MKSERSLASEGEGFALCQYFGWGFFLPSFQPFQVLPGLSKVVRQKFWDFVDDGVPATALGTCKHALNDLFLLLEYVEFERVMFVEWTREDLHQPPFHETLFETGPNNRSVLAIFLSSRGRLRAKHKAISHSDLLKGINCPVRGHL